MTSTATSAKRLAGKGLDDFRGKLRPRLGHVQTAVAGKAGQQHVLEPKLRRFASCRDVVHVDRSLCLLLQKLSSVLWPCPYAFTRSVESKSHRSRPDTRGWATTGQAGGHNPCGLRGASAPVRAYRVAACGQIERTPRPASPRDPTMSRRTPDAGLPPGSRWRTPSGHPPGLAGSRFGVDGEGGDSRRITSGRTSSCRERGGIAVIPAVALGIVLRGEGVFHLWQPGQTRDRDRLGNLTFCPGRRVLELIGHPTAVDIDAPLGRSQDGEHVPTLRLRIWCVEVALAAMIECARDLTRVYSTFSPAL